MEVFKFPEDSMQRAHILQEDLKLGEILLSSEAVNVL